MLSKRSDRSNQNKMEVVVGTYNHVLFGFKFLQHEDEDQEEKSLFSPLFTDQGHAGLVKSVASGGRYLASGSSDETIRLFDMKKHVEIGTLVEQRGTITSIVFSGSSHMLTGSEDGTICIWKCRSWELEKTLKGHRGAVHSLSIHPTGRLALSVSKDKTIKTWNLLTGRAAYTTTLKEVGEIVCWTPKGNSYAIVVGCKITIYQINGLKDPIEYRCDKYILAVEFISQFVCTISLNDKNVNCDDGLEKGMFQEDTVVALAGESEDIIFYEFEKNLVIQRLSAHKTRTKGLSVVPHHEDKEKLLMFTVASDGNLKAWSLNKNDLEEECRLLASIDIPGRPTCLTVKLPPKPSQKNETNTIEEYAENEENEELSGEDSEDEQMEEEEVEEKKEVKQKKTNANKRTGKVEMKKKTKKKKAASAGD